MNYINPGTAHVHAKHPADKWDVRGFRIVSWMFEDPEWYISVTIDGVNVISYEELEKLVRPRKLEVVPFGVIDECCDLNKG